MLAVPTTTESELSEGIANSSLSVVAAKRVRGNNTVAIATATAPSATIIAARFILISAYGVSPMAIGALGCRRVAAHLSKSTCCFASFGEFVPANRPGRADRGTVDLRVSSGTI